MTRSVDDLEQTLRDFIARTPRPLSGPSRKETLAALSELVALAGTLTQERDEARHQRTTELMDANVALCEFMQRAEAAEAALAETREELVRWQTACGDGSVALADMRRALEETLDAAAPLVAPDIELSQLEWNAVMSELRAVVWRHTALAAAGPAPEETTPAAPGDRGEAT